MSAWWAKEPAIIAALPAVISSLFGLLAAFGHPLTQSQQEAIFSLVAALGAIGAIVTRSQSVPVASLPASQPVAVAKP
jgi:hypothetical protein